YDVPGVGLVDSACLEQILDRTDICDFEVAQNGDGTLRIRWVAAPGDPSAAERLERELREVIGGGGPLPQRHIDELRARGGKPLRFVKQPRTLQYEAPAA